MTSILKLWQAHGRPYVLGDVGPDINIIQQRLLYEGFDPKGIDGEIGKDTRRAVTGFQKSRGLLDDGRIAELTATAMDGETAPPVIKVTSDPPWLTRAVSLIGTLEAPGPRDNPVILAWAAACGGQIAATYKHDSTAWCKMFLEYCLRSTGYHGTDDLWALNARKIGTSLPGPVVGAIASKERTGGGHTFFVRARNAQGMIVGTGGNMSDAVCNGVYDPRVLKYNWPDGYPVPVFKNFNSLPLLNVGKFTREN